MIAFCPLVVTSCGGSGTAPVSVASVVVALASSSIAVGDNTNASATARDAHGNALTGRTIAWSTADQAIATVTSDGSVHAVQIGSTRVVATSEGHEGSATLTVTPVPVATVNVTLAVNGLFTGETTQATASVKDAHGTVITDRAIAWSSTNAGVATVTADGVVTAVTAGVTQIVATSEGRSGAASLTVTPAPVASVTVSVAASVGVGRTTQATATLKDARDNVLTGRSISWSSDNPNLASINAVGLVTGFVPGIVNITATSEGKSGSAPITVVVPAVASVSVALAAPVLHKLSRTQATALPKDAEGIPITGAAITWSSDKPVVASVSESGIVTANSLGTANITATVGGTPGSAAVTVTSDIGYGSSTEKVHIVDIGTTFTPTISPNPSSITFTSRSTSVATVNAQGTVTGVGVGQTWITATAAGLAPDSIYVIVPKNSTGPLLRTDLTNYLFQAGMTSVVVTAVIDTRSTPIGGAELSVGFPAVPFILRMTNVTAVGSAAPVVKLVQGNTYRISVASANPLAGQQALVQFTFDIAGISPSEINRSGFIALTLLDVVDVTGANLLPVSTSTRFPIIMQ
jgi:uncharacterized protein YjdB